MVFFLVQHLSPMSHTEEYVRFLTYITLKRCTKKLLQESANGLTSWQGKIPFQIHFIGLKKILPPSFVEHRSQISYHLSFYVYQAWMTHKRGPSMRHRIYLLTTPFHLDILNCWQFQEDQHFTSHHAISDIAVGRVFPAEIVSHISWSLFIKT